MSDSTTSKTVQHWYLHVDLDAFFASVEQLDHPEYRGKPVIVGGKPEDRRGVVSTASYEARKFGVHSAMPTVQAYKLCPQGIFVHGNMARYHELSYAIMNIFKQYSPDVDQMSIDEAFIDLTGTEKLFGDPKDTALKIKKEVKDRTGLTVSIGLAASKYIAKIASGYSKPDGFYVVEPGKEKDFMLSLPLNKLWGAGDKTQTALNKAGIKTTRNLYERDLEQLEFLFGKNSANFLYNSVRGNNQDSFTRQTKSHSLSNERTFGYDIYDIYTAETYILELSQYVLFRLLKEGGFSRTIFLKLRYDDFTTTSIQQTFDSPILTVDTYYDAIIKLFHKRYEKGRGIRLIGLGFDNIEKEDRSHQYSLFEEPDEKKQKIEKAILNLEHKHPEIKIHKARILTKNLKMLFCGLLLSLFVHSNKTTAQEYLDPVSNKGEEPLVLYNFQLNDKDKVDFLVSGYWLMSLEYSAKANLGKDFFVSSSIPVFKQEIDIYTWLMLNKQWYFEADFANEFKKNTFALGYNGKGVLKSGRLSNRKITMPTYYSAETFGFGVGGGSNQAPGLSLHFQDPVNQKWSGDFILRYDMTKAQSATFYGYNSVTDSKIDLTAFEYGQSFILPENSTSQILNIKDIYVESTKGTYIDSNKKKYVKLSKTQYLLFSSTGQIILSENANAGRKDNKTPTVLITFIDNHAVEQILTETGSYNDSASFAGKIQEYFNLNKKYELNNFSYTLSTIIEDEAALVIQNSTGFSPYLIANSYDCGIIASADTSIISKYTEAINTKYETYILNQDLMYSIEDFFSLNHTYIGIQKSKLNSSDFQLPENRYPFGDTNPEIYLNLITDTDQVLLIRNYQQVSEFNIGTQAAKDTVQVYINDILDSMAIYDEDSGNVKPGKKINEKDKIYIVWQEDSSQIGNGSLVAGTGFYYNFNQQFKGDASLTFRWPMNSYAKYSTVDSPSVGFGALAAGITYENQKENLYIKAAEKTAVALQTDNPTGILLAAFHEEDSNNTYYLNRTDGFITKATPILNLETQTIYLDENKNCTVQNHTGSTDSFITGYKIPLEWNLISQDADNWASVDIHLENSTILSSSQSFQLAIQPYFASTPLKGDYDIYLQLGITAAESFTGELSNSIPTWKISEMSSRTLNPLDITDNQWQTISVFLNDQERSKLISNHDARIIIVSNELPKESKGTLFIGPYEPHKQSIFAYADSNINISTDNVISESESSKNLFRVKNYDSTVSWQIDSPNLITNYENSEITTISYFKAADYSPYKTINFDFAIEATTSEVVNITDTGSSLIFILDTDAKNSQNTGNIGLKIELTNIANYISSSCNYHTLTFNKENNKVYIDNAELNPSDYKLSFNGSVVPSRQKIVFSTISEGSLISKGTFYVSNLYYKGSSAYVSAQNNISTTIEKTGTILAINDFQIIQDGKLSASTNQKVSFMSETINNNNVQITANENGEITLTGITFSSALDTEYNQGDSADKVLNFGGHSINTKEQLLNFLEFSENYNYYKKEKNLNKEDGIKFDFNNLKVPLVFGADFSADQWETQQTQKVNFETQSVFKVNENSTQIKAAVSASQKLSSLNYRDSFYEMDNYFTDWWNINSLQFSIGSDNSYTRTVGYNFSIADTYKNFSPVFEYKIQDSYQNKTSSNFTDTSVLSVKLPFNFSRNAYYFNLSHTGIGLQSYAGSSYIDDSVELFTLAGTNRSWFYSSIPFYELFSKKSGPDLLNKNLSYQSDYLLFNTKYELGWKRKLNNNISDIFIPSSTVFAVSRELKAANTLSDLYQFKSIITNTSLNNFGSKSKTKIFKWYEQDELLTSLTGIIKMPADIPKNTTYQLSAYSRLILFIKNNNNLKNVMDFNVDTNKDWSYKINTSYSRKTQDSLFVPLIKLWVKEKQNPDFNISRKDSIYVTLDHKEDINKQKYEYLHSVDINLLTYYTINFGAGLDYVHIKHTGDSAGIILTVGAKMEF